MTRTYRPGDVVRTIGQSYHPRNQTLARVRGQIAGGERRLLVTWVVDGAEGSMAEEVAAPATEEDVLVFLLAYTKKGG